MSQITLIDTHAHYNRSVMSDLEEQINSVNKNKDVLKIINVGLDNVTSEEAVKISCHYSKFYAALGVHPLYNGSIKALEELYFSYDNRKIVAIGETGIDTKGDIFFQVKKFIESIRLANHLRLPLIIHANTIKGSKLDANRYCLEMIKIYRPLYGFVFHFFQPDLQLIEEIVRLGGYISVGSNIIKPNAKKSLEMVKIIPIDRLLIETDYLFLTKCPNETGKATFNKICELRREKKLLMMNQLNDNAMRLFPKLK